MKRMFDLHTAAVTEGAHTTKANLSWKNARNFQFKPPVDNLDKFEITEIRVTPWGDTDRQMLSVDFTCSATSPTRFLAIVTCDTDEPDEQGDLAEIEAELRASWPKE